MLQYNYFLCISLWVGIFILWNKNLFAELESEIYYAFIHLSNCKQLILFRVAGSKYISIIYFYTCYIRWIYIYTELQPQIHAKPWYCPSRDNKTGVYLFLVTGLKKVVRVDCFCGEACAEIFCFWGDCFCRNVFIPPLVLGLDGWGLMALFSSPETTKIWF